MRKRLPHTLSMAVALCAALSGCARAPLTPDPGPNAVAAVAPEPRAAPQPSEESMRLQMRYARLERDLVSRGLLRRDRGGPDTPVDSRMLTENFMQIALFDEFVPDSDRIIARESASALRRWNDRVDIELVFGASVPDAERARDRATVTALAGRLATATGHPVGATTGSGNMKVFVVSEDERRALGPRLRSLIPGISPPVVRAVTDMPPTIFCLMIAFSTDDAPFVYRRAVAIIRAEHPPLLRQSCLHEEIAQGLGLANDSPAARPSIFNDDEEFALLTTHDELLLAILYDPRLQPGMDAATAQPIVRTIAEELLPPAISARMTPALEES
jgi:hypothetical protein